MGESRNAYRVLVGRPEGKRPLGRPRRRWEDNIKMDLREVGYDDRDWINLGSVRGGIEDKHTGISCSTERSLSRFLLFSCLLIAAQVNEECNKQVSPQTIRRTLKTEDFDGRVVKKKPYVSEVNRRKLNFAKEYIQKAKNWWNDVFADESPYKVLGQTGGQWCGEDLIKSYKNKPSANCEAWWRRCDGLGCISARGVGELENGPKRTAYEVRTWLLYNCSKVIRNPAQSPDLNAIKNLWDELDRRIRTELKRRLLKEWDSISSNYSHIQKLVSSTPKRLNAYDECREVYENGWDRINGCNSDNTGRSGSCEQVLQELSGGDDSDCDDNTDTGNDDEGDNNYNNVVDDDDYDDLTMSAISIIMILMTMMIILMIAILVMA
ncbi:hypothetical protein ANN_00758 [Periplaneta americana]|uniref:Transposase Tc1-like domain-containing protein n=1 Tax=Periplaneta americana TaxID=6978 RepID=A0ABQ8TUM2_PERAM|nr:hypothetical protein ANN_00758 [Periplaneta americana]